MFSRLCNRAASFVACRGSSQVKVKGQLRISGNHKMQTLGTSFKALTTIVGSFQVYSNNKMTEGIKKSFASLNSVAGIDMNQGGKFNPATEIYMGTIDCNPSSNRNFGSVAELATALKDTKLITGALQIQHQLASLTSLPSQLGQKLLVVTGQVYLYQLKGLKNLNGLFPVLGSVGGLSINNNPQMTTLGTAFKSLEAVVAAEKNSNANFYMQSNEAMQSLSNIFPKLRRVGGKVQVSQMKQVTNADGAFPELTSTKGQVEISYLYKIKRISTMFSKLEQTGPSVGAEHHLCCPSVSRLDKGPQRAAGFLLLCDTGVCTSIRACRKHMACAHDSAMVSCAMARAHAYLYL